jgi:hypothetical protein
MENKNKTAVAWLLDQLPDESRLTKRGFEMLQQAKQIEKEQIVRARVSAPLTTGDIVLDAQEAEAYYNQKYLNNDTQD